jgi:hypothetical protein
MPRRKEPKIPDAILDQLLAGAEAKTAKRIRELDTRKNRVGEAVGAAISG